MGSKKHKKHKSDRRDRYEEYSNNMDPAQLQRSGALKLILKVGANSTPEYDGNSPLAAGPPTAAEAMMSEAPLSPNIPNELLMDVHRSEKHKKSKKKKKKKDRERKHKHHKEKRHRSGEHKRSAAELQQQRGDDSLDHLNECIDDASLDAAGLAGDGFYAQRSIKALTEADPESSQDAFSLLDDDNSQPLPEHILMYANITTDNSPSCRPVSKPIVPLKIDDLLADSPASSSMQSTLTGATTVVAAANAAGSPIKPLPDLLIPSPSPSTQASTPGGGSSVAALTPKALEAPKTPSTSSESGREPRTCVLKLKQQKTPLNKLLDHLLRFLEKRDPHQFFAWPVTDDIAPGYSGIISKPMDFSTMRQKIDDSEYTTLSEFREDFRLMCENAIRYNHVDTVYNKAAKRLMQIGMKHLQPENLMRTLKPLASYLREITSKELGFELLSNDSNYEQHCSMDSADEGASTGNDEPTPAQLEAEEKRRALRAENEPKTHFEPYVDDMTSEEILAQVQAAAQSVKKKLSAKEKAHQMGFLRQNKDGTTSLQLLIKEENEGPEKVISIGDLVGKLKTGSGQMHGLRLDKRNDAKIVRPLHYGPFTSFAPTLDTRFSNLNPEETKLVLNTYGDASSAEYAESILEFSKDSDYASRLANSLLDILTNGDHSKSMAELYDMQMQNYEEQEVLKCFNTPATYSTAAMQAAEARQKIEEEYEKYKNTRIDFNRLRTLKDLGIDVSFLDSLEEEVKSFELTRRLQEHLSNNLTLIEKLRNTQHERLSQPLPEHLAHVPQAGAEETHVAHQLTQQLTDLAKKLPPMAIADTYAVRKAMGIGCLPAPTQPIQRLPLPDLLQHPVAMPQLNLPNSLLSSGSTLPEHNHAPANVSSMAMDIDEGSSLEHELREFLESGPDLNATNNSNDDNIVAQLLMN